MQSTQTRGAHALGVNNVIAELARLALRAASSGGDTHIAVAEALLDQILTACGAQRGAVILTAPTLVTAGRGRGESQGIELVRMLTMRGMDESLARRLLATPHTLDTPAKGDAGIVWMIHSLALADYLGSPLPSRGLWSHTQQPSAAQVIVGWHNGQSGSAAAAQARDVLDALTDAVAAVIVNMLLAQRTHELESAAAEREALLREVEEARGEWEQTFDSVSDPICVLTPDYRVVRANTAYLKIFGLSRDWRGGHECFVIGPGRDSPCPGCTLPRTIQTQRPAFMQQERMVPVGPDGAMERRQFQTWTYPVFNADGAVDRVVEIMKDVTEQDRLRQVTIQAEALREADHLKAELLGTVSHELRSPLAAIKGYAATLLRHERRLPREERHEFLMAIGEASDRMELIIDRLLQMSQLETGAMRVELSPVDMGHVAGEAIQAAEERAATRSPGRFTFVTRMIGSDGAPTTSLPLVLADPRSIRDVLDNLLENAVKYSPEGGEIELSLRVVKPEPVRERAYGEIDEEATQAGGVASGFPHVDREMLEIRVRDSGVGIPSEHLGRIFDRFHRVDTRLTREVDGLGLGLAICRRIVDLHHGAIWAESESGEGSTFHVLLPINDMSAQSALVEDH